MGLASQSTLMKTFLPQSLLSDADLTEMQTEFGIRGFWSQEIEHRTLKGRCFWGNLASKRIQVAERQLNLVRVTDISDRKAAETALQISEQNLRTIFNHVSSYIFIHEVDGPLLDINDRALERFGLEREQALQLSILEDYSAPDNPLHLAQDYWTRALAGEPVRFEWKAKEIRTGKPFDVDIALNRIIWDGKLVILADVVDVSDRKQAAIRLKQQAGADQLLATIAQTINQSVHLDEVLDFCLEQMRQFLQCDRVLIGRLLSNATRTLAMEFRSSI
jgi:PAS domain S-box-containing protein